MAVALSVHPFGDGAFAALERAVRQGQGGDPLASVTVVVDRGAVGLSARRRLASRPGGIAGVRFLTWPRLAADLAAAWLASTDRPALTPAMELEAVRAVLAGGHRGPLAAVADQPSTVRAVARTCRELAGVPDASLDALARQSTRSAEVVAVARAVQDRLRRAFGTHELLAAAADAVRRGAPVATGPVVAYLPERPGPGECDLLDALSAAVPVSVIAGSTGEAAADVPVRALAARYGTAGADPSDGAGGADPSDGAGGTGRARTWVRSAPSADAEVLMALRYLLRRNAEGVPLERMALLHGGAPPYPVLARDLAAAAGLPTHGPGTRPLSASIAGRVLAGALALGDRDWRRDEVAAWLGCGPLLHAGRAVPSAEWDRLSCEAGVVSGLGQWRDRLAVHAAALRARAELLDRAPDEEGRRLAAACRLDAGHCLELWRFLEGLAGRLAEAPRAWGTWGEWGRRLLIDLLGDPSRRATWPLPEIAAFDAVLAVLGTLGSLDWIGGPDPRPGDFRSALLAELDRPAPETTRFGRGVLVGPLTAGMGLDLDVVCVVGVVDGTFLAGAGDDVLVPDRERLAAGPAVPLRGATHAEARRAYLAVMAGAPERVLSYPRGDQRTGREQRPARPLLDALSAFAPGDDRLHAGDVRHGPPPGVPRESFEFVRSFAEAVQDEDGDGEPLCVADWELRSLTRWRRARPDLSGHFLARADPVLSGALSARRARRSRRLTRFDGMVDGGDVASPLGAGPQSATGLEAYARCPRSYLFATLLGLAERPVPEDVLQLTPMERGIVVHRILEQLVAGERGEQAGAPTIEATKARMLELAAAAFSELEQQGLTGHPALWAIDRARIVGDLRQFVRDDAAYRAATGAAPVAVEDLFGFGDDPGVEIQLGPGRTVRFRGRVDRVDAVPDGGLRVIDYKTGRLARPPGDGDPLAGGTCLQLPVYALAARRRHGATGPVTAGYWYVGAQAAPAGMALDGAVVDRLTAVVGTAVGGIERGVFPANPGRTDPSTDARTGNCHTCAFDRMCPADRVTAWARKRDDPAVEAYRGMTEPA